MGADLILTWAPWPRANGVDIPIDVLRQRIANEIQKLPDNTLAAAYENLTGDFPLYYEEENGAEEVAATLGDWRSEIRERLSDATKEVFPGPDEFRRSLIVIEVRDVRIILAGGTSWGDSPAEEFDALCLLNEAGLLHDN